MALLGSKRVDRKLANARVDRKLANARATLIGAGPSQTRRMLNKPMVYVEAPIANDNGKRGSDVDDDGKRGGDSNETTMPTDAGPLPFTESVDACAHMSSAPGTKCGDAIRKLSCSLFCESTCTRLRFLLRYKSRVRYSEGSGQGNLGKGVGRS